MHRSHTEIYLHLVWATYRRLPLVTAQLEPLVHGHIVGEARRLRCGVLAVGGMPDHVHLAVRLNPTVSVSRLLQQLKGVSSTRVRQALGGETFGWQDNYGAFSFAGRHSDRVIAYIHTRSVAMPATGCGRPWKARTSRCRSPDLARARVRRTRSLSPYPLRVQ